MFKILQKAWRWITLLYKKIQPFVTDYIIPAINIVNGIKNQLENPGTDDPFLQANYPVIIKIIKGFKIFDTCIKKPTNEEIIACFLTTLAKQPKIVQESIYLKLAAGIVRANKDVKALNMSDSETEALVQLTYAKIKHEQNC